MELYSVSMCGAPLNCGFFHITDSPDTIQHVPITKVSLLQSGMHTNPALIDP